MKKGIVLLLVISSVCTEAQTLKDALFSGKLKTDSGTVIRKGDDLSSKIDTTRTTPQNEMANTVAAPLEVDSSTQSIATQTDTATLTTSGTTNGAINSTKTATSPTAAPANNNTVWKTYMDSVANTIKTEALSSKKVKRGDYAVMVTYAIGTDGQTTVTDVFLSPENSYLQQQIKTRLEVDTPRLNPVLNSAGTPRRAIKKYSFTLSKE